MTVSPIVSVPPDAYRGAWTAKLGSPPGDRLWIAKMGATMKSLSDRSVQGAGLVVLSACCFGAMVLFGRWAYADGVAPTSLLFMRFAIAAPLLCALVLWRRRGWPRGRSALVTALMGGVFVGNSLAYFVALTRVPAGVVAILFFTYPAIVMVGERLVFGQRFGKSRLLALVLALVGGAVTVGPTVIGSISGAALALLAAGIYAVYVLLARGVTAGTDALAQAAVITTVAAVIFGFLVGRQELTLPATSSGWAAVVALAVVSTVIAIWAFLAGASRLGPTGAATLSVAEPVMAALLAAALLDEPLRAGAMVGAALIGASTLLIVNCPTLGRAPLEKYAKANG